MQALHAKVFHDDVASVYVAVAGSFVIRRAKLAISEALLRLVLVRAELARPGHKSRLKLNPVFKLMSILVELLHEVKSLHVVRAIP
jgi:hypothetical protein